MGNNASYSSSTSFAAPSSASSPSSVPQHHQQYLRTFTSDELFAMTAGFSRSRRIGEGGFGQVFAGDLLCSSSSRSASPPSPSSSPSRTRAVAVAVKLLEPGSLQGEAEFEAEVCALRGREPSPNIVRLLGICVEGGGAGTGAGEAAVVAAAAAAAAAGQGRAGVVRAAVLERVEGGESVADALEGPSSLPWADRVAVAAGAAAGLSALHAAPAAAPSAPRGGGGVGIAHGDISAMNVLVARRSHQPVTGVLCDFGLSSPASGPPAAARGRAATRGYEAPEARCLLERAAAASAPPSAARSSLPPLDPAAAAATAASADIYALGVLLIDLLTGTPASGGGSSGAAERRRAAAEAAATGDLELLSSQMDLGLFPESPNRLPPPAHSVAAVAEAAAGCLARDPRERPSAAAVASYLAKALNVAMAAAATSAASGPPPLRRPDPAAAASPAAPASAAASQLLPGFPATEEAPAGTPNGGAAAAAPAATVIPDLLSAPPPPLGPPAPAAPRSALPASFNPFD